jgi:hypothetical protein
MKTLLLASCVLAACATDDPNGTDASGATALPIVTATGPDILGVKLRCIEVQPEEVTTVIMKLEIASSSMPRDTKGAAAVMIGSSRMSFELDGSDTDYLEARMGQEAAMATVCDSALVTLLDVALMSSEGTVTVDRLRVVPAWQSSL